MNVAIEMPRSFADRPTPEKPASTKRADDSPFEERLREARERDDTQRQEAGNSAERAHDDKGVEVASAGQAGEKQSRSTGLELDTGFAEQIEAEASIAASAGPDEATAEMPDPTGQAAMPMPTPAQAPQTGVGPLPQAAGDAAANMAALRMAGEQPKAQPEGAGIQMSKGAAPAEDTLTGKGQNADPPFDVQRLLGEDAARTANGDPLSKTQPSTPPPPRPIPAAVPLDHVAVHIAKSAASDNDRIQIQLTPASLGTIDVDLELTEDGRVDAVVRVEKPETLELLQRDARQLVRALQDAGLQADGGSLSFELRDQGGRQDQPAPRGHADGADAREPGTKPAPQPPIRRQMAGGVDIIA